MHTVVSCLSRFHSILVRKTMFSTFNFLLSLVIVSNYFSFSATSAFHIKFRMAAALPGEHPTTGGRRKESEAVEFQRNFEN